MPGADRVARPAGAPRRVVRQPPPRPPGRRRRLRTTGRRRQPNARAAQRRQVRRRSRRDLAGAALLAALLLTAAACGQKSGVAGQVVGSDGTSVVRRPTSSPTGRSPTAARRRSTPARARHRRRAAPMQVPAAARHRPAGGTSSGGGGSRPTTGGGGTTGTGGGGGGSAPAPSGPADRTGITATTIKIGIHAPETGAAAVSTFRQAVGVYSEYAGAIKGLGGRRIQVVARDDHFDPATARSVCKEMVEKEKVFLLIGGAGVDQIKSCAEYAASVGVPYLSPGVTEGPFRALQNYFALSETYTPAERPDRAVPQEHGEEDEDRHGPHRLAAAERDGGELQGRSEEGRPADRLLRQAREGRREDADRHAGVEPQGQGGPGRLRPHLADRLHLPRQQREAAGVPADVRRAGPLGRREPRRGRLLARRRLTRTSVRCRRWCSWT